MLFFAPDEHDNDRDEEDEDADFDENSENEDEEGDDADDKGDDDSDGEGDDSEDDDDNKPVTRKELRELLGKNQNKRNAGDRVSKKGRVTKPSPDSSRLDTLEKTIAETQVAEKKRTFGYDNNLSPKQTNYVFKLTKRPTPKFLAQPHVKAALDAIKAQENVKRNTPSGSGGKSYRPPEGKKWTELPPEQRQSNFADRRRGILESKQR